MATDANGNRLTNTVDGSPTSYTYAPGTNRLATVAGSPIGSDGVGRITSVPGATYHYSASNRLQSVRQNGVTVAGFAYDHRGLRRRKSTGYMGVHTTVYHHDEAGHLLAETNQSYPFGEPRRDRARPPRYLWRGCQPSSPSVTLRWTLAASRC